MRTTPALPEVNGRLAEASQPRRYQTNASLNQPPTRTGDRPVREYVTNVTRRRAA
jgi:hypothetical protein